MVAAWAGGTGACEATSVRLPLAEPPDVAR